MRGTLRTFSVAAAGALALLITAFAGTAVAKDRNHDQIPDKWEKRYHLSLKVDQANKGDDNEGDDGGGDQSHEIAGVIASFENGVLTINVDGGGEVSGAVDSNTEIDCETADESEVGDDSSPGLESESGDIEEPGDDETGSGDDDTPGDGVEEPGADACTQDDLTQGTTVHEADLENGTFTEIELVK
jgi:hypothetical protein